METSRSLCYGHSTLYPTSECIATSCYECYVSMYPTSKHSLLIHVHLFSVSPFAVINSRFLHWNKISNFIVAVCEFTEFLKSLFLFLSCLCMLLSRVNNVILLEMWMCNNNIYFIKQLLCEFLFIESVNIFVFSFKHVFGNYASSESSGRKLRVARERDWLIDWFIRPWRTLRPRIQNTTKIQ